MNNPFLESVTNWVMRPEAWFAPGPIAQFIGVALLVMVILQALPNTAAGGILFARKNAWITYYLMAVYLMVVFVIPFIGWVIGLVLVVILTLVLFGANRREAWKTQ